MKSKNSFEVRDNYLYVKIIGKFEPSIARDDISEFIEKAIKHNLRKILCDLTSLTGFDEVDISFMTKFDLAEFASNSMPLGFRLAILGTSQQLSGDIGETVMSNRGVLVKSTSNLQEALEWLGVAAGDKLSGN